MSTDVSSTTDTTETGGDESVQITERAAKEFRHVLSRKGLPEDTGMRISVKGGGCSGFEYQLDIDSHPADEFDVETVQHGIRVVVDMKSEFYMAGTTIDFNDGLMDRGFTFTNPLASGTCGCGSSFSI
ncbi:MAG: iron-sulfur cluster assembly accessory protein [Planctomycetes bacterium]|nr:iron-sulfur cluster assembly accessory protein [Planctomycetota bacterium]